jgi:hypothetical protein
LYGSSSKTLDVSRTKYSVGPSLEAASVNAPKNTDYLFVLFKEYAKDHAFVKQQQCAMKLYRLTNDPNHIMWAVCSMLLQRDPKLLQLAAGRILQTVRLQLVLEYYQQYWYSLYLDRSYAPVYHSLVVADWSRPMPGYFEVVTSVLGC